MWRVLPDGQAQVQAGAADPPTRTLLRSSAVTSETRDRERVMTQRDFPFVFFTFSQHFFTPFSDSAGPFGQRELANVRRLSAAKANVSACLNSTQPPDVVCSALIKNRLLNLKMCLKMQKKKNQMTLIIHREQISWRLLCWNNGDVLIQGKEFLLRCPLYE